MAAIMTKRCSMCEVELSLDDFWKSARERQGVQSSCKVCQSEARRQRHADNPDAARARQRKCRYGISYEVYESMLEDQGGVCSICKCPETATAHGTIRTLSVDHDHATGDVRGLLCQKCNTAIGMFEDEVERLKGAVEYLTRDGG